MDTDSLYSCTICIDPYDGEVRPHTLNCGHSFCTNCLNNSIENGVLVCPHCQQSHRASSAHDFPINYSMEEMISKFKAATHFSESHPHQSGAMSQNRHPTLHMPTPSAPNFPHKSGTMSSKMQSIIHEHKESTLNLVHESKEIQSQLHQYKNFLLERKAKHEELDLQISDLANRNKEMANRFDTEYEKLNEVHKEGEYLENMVNTNLENLETITSTKSALDAIDDLDKCYVALEEWNQSCQEQIPNLQTLNHSEKVVRDTTAALSMVNTEEEEGAAATLSFDLTLSSLSISDKLKRIRERYSVTLRSLQNMTESMKNLLGKGRVYAVQHQEGRVRSAKVTLKDNKTYLHYLQDGEPPVYAHTIQQSDLIRTLRPDSVVAFLDLAWEGSIQGRVHVFLSPVTPYAHHFRLLCTGDHGFSYARSRFLQVANKGSATYEWVLGGDYEHNDGSGGAPLIKGLNRKESIYNRRWVEGNVGAECGEIGGPKSAQFTITTGTGTSECRHGFFGQVQEGLDVVKAAVKRNDVRGVTIADCGVMLSF